MEQRNSQPWIDMFNLIKYFLFEFDPLGFVSPKDDPQYLAWFRERSQSLSAYNQLSRLLGPSLVVWVILCLLRITFFRYIMGLKRQEGRGRRTAAAATAGASSSSEAEASGDETTSGSRFRSSTELLAKHASRTSPPAKRAATAAAVAAEAEVEAAAAAAAEAPSSLARGECCWSLVGGSGLLLWGWWCVASSNGGCPAWPSLDTSHCLAGWPLLPVPPLVRWYYCCEAAWYLHLLVKRHLGVGLQDRGLMVAHHIVSVALILLSYCFSLHRPGVLLLALLNSSTPLLHMSKWARIEECRRVAVPAFAAFTAVFFISRVVLFPLFFLPLGVIQPLRYVPRVLELFPGLYTLFNGLLGLLVVMQWVWFGAVIRVLRQVVAGNEAKVEAEARRWVQQTLPTPTAEPSHAPLMRDKQEVADQNLSPSTPFMLSPPPPPPPLMCRADGCKTAAAAAVAAEAICGDEGLTRPADCKGVADGASASVSVSTVPMLLLQPMPHAVDAPAGHLCYCSHCNGLRAVCSGFPKKSGFASSER